MHVDRLLKIREAILTEPLRINMDIWAEEFSETDDFLDFLEINEISHTGVPPCRSIGCIGGWAEMLFPSLGLGASSLGLTNRQAAALFYGYHGIGNTLGWPSSLRLRLATCTPGSQEYANVVAEAIDDFIATDCWGL